MPNSYVLDAHALIWHALQLIRQGETVALLTKDANITASKLVPVIW